MPSVKRTVGMLALVFMALACKEQRPEEVLSKTEMVEILEEIYVREALLNQLSLSRDSVRVVADMANQRVFDSVGVTETAFRRSMEYYMARPEQLEDIYTALVDTLQLREQRANRP